MSKKVKLLWDFKGPDALKTAKHHCIHLKEFSAIENLIYHDVSTSVINDFFAVAFIVINEVDIDVYKNSLKPHRGQLVKD